MDILWVYIVEPNKKNKTFSELQEELDHMVNEGDEPESVIAGYRGSRKSGIQ